MDLSIAVAEFVERHGADGPVAIAGGRTAWELGGRLSDDASVIDAPAIDIDHRPEELVVTVDAGVALGELRSHLARNEQRVILDGPSAATVGGSLAVGRSGLHRLGDGHVRDALLGATMVGADGRAFRIGGATVKNVSGFDLCRLMVGALGTLATFATAILRTVPLPEVEEWRTGPGDPFQLRAALWRPGAIFWDGRSTWACLRGSGAHVASQRDVAANLGVGEEVSGPPELSAHRWSVRPSELSELVTSAEPGSVIAELGVGLVHRTVPAPACEIDPVAHRLVGAVRDRFDPHRRLNPGRDPERVS